MVLSRIHCELVGKTKWVFEHSLESKSMSLAVALQEAPASFPKLRANCFLSTIDEQSINVKPPSDIQQEVFSDFENFEEDANIVLDSFALRSNQQVEMEKVDKKNSSLTKLLPSCSSSTSSEMEFETVSVKADPSGEFEEEDPSALVDEKPNLVWNPYSLRARREVKLEPVISRRRIKAEPEFKHERVELGPKAKHVNLIEPKKVRANEIKADLN